MHVHGHQPNVSGISLAGAHAVETASALKRARELREAALRMKAASLEAEVSPDAVAMIGSWSQEAGSHESAGDRRRALPDAAEEGNAEATAVSYWA